MTKISSSAFSTSWPMTFARGRNGDVYGVNGEERGFRWDTVTANTEQLGISAPASAPSITANTSSPLYDLVSAQLLDGGQGYNSPPTVTITGSPTTAAVLRPRMSGGGLVQLDTLRYGSGYTTPPSVTVSAPSPTAETDATVSVTTTTFTITLPDGSTETKHRVSSVSVGTAGTRYGGSPQIVFSGAGPGGAIGEVVLSSGGAVASIRMLQGGIYNSAPTASIVRDPSYQARQALIEPVMRPGINGKYWYALRYVDDTSAALGGPLPSSISTISSLEVGSPAGKLVWTWSNASMETRVANIELWRTTADQALVLYKVATVANDVTTYDDTLSDAQLANPARTGFASLPITLPNGAVNARRFTPPPQNKRAIAIFQDRAWYGVDAPGRTFAGGTDAAASEPNTLYFSEADEPESVPEVNQVVIQENVKGQDRVTALMPFGGGMVVFQERHAYRLSFVSQPLIDANVSMICQRGCLNQRCWDVFDDVAYVVDASGMYILDGSQAVPISDAVDTFWSDNIIHFASSKWFFVRVDPTTRVVRFHFSVTAGFPDRALCFHPLTKAWWVETYAQTFAAAECLRTGNRMTLMAGGQAGAILKFDSGNSDLNSSGDATGISCYVRTGNMSLNPQDKDRAIRLLYAPTTATCSLSLALHYNGSASPRQAAVVTDRGTGFTTTAGGPATLNLARARSALGDATGMATANYSGRIDERSAGADRHLAMALSLTRPSSESVTLYGAAVGGVAQ